MDSICLLCPGKAEKCSAKLDVLQITVAKAFLKSPSPVDQGSSSGLLELTAMTYREIAVASVQHLVVTPPDTRRMGDL
ncbi:hypothetical protein FRC03_012237 [Tulasnella sp. 419]|nr:hypothetical protein FRC03_012237 [Tulasnella sp. 419]